jgi:CHAD domain-containing protein
VASRFTTIGSYVRAAILAALDRAIAALSGDTPPDEDRVHDARLELKAARAWLRLWRGPAAARLAEDRRELTRIARALGAARDEQVVVATVAQLCRRIPDPPPPLGRPGDGAAGTDWALAPARLLAVRQRLVAHAWPPLSEAAVAAALRHSYRRMRRRRAAVCARRLAARVHEWRKAVIVLREQIDLLTPRLPKRARRTHADLVQLARQLGRAGDLRLVEVWLRAQRSGEAAAAADTWLRAVRTRRRRLVERALRWSGERKLLSPSPRRWMEKLRPTDTAAAARRE